jgi:hypothetical protein
MRILVDMQRSLFAMLAPLKPRPMSAPLIELALVFGLISVASFVAFATL